MTITPIQPVQAERVAKRIVVAGGSGLIGRALEAHLRAEGHAVQRLVRHARSEAGGISWDPARGELEPGAIEGADAIVNLAGANIAAGRWTGTRKTDIRQSRISATRTLVQAIASARQKPAVMVNASAVGFYGDRGDEVLTEQSRRGAGFLADVCAEWEAAAAQAEPAGTRVVLARFGMVLAAHGGALAKLRPLFRWALGGRIGDGRQWMSWISIRDAVRAISHAIVSPDLRGAVNIVAPQPVTNCDFTTALAAALRRPAFLPVPAPLLRLALGEMAEATMLASARALPTRLLSTGFAFEHPVLRVALQQVLSPKVLATA